MKKYFFSICLFFILSTFLYGQDTKITNNNTITINGNVYYFKLSISPSSPSTQVTYSSDWIGDGERWGEDAVKAWTSIVDWVLLHCNYKTDSNYDKNQTNVYINRITAQRDFKCGKTRTKA